MATPDAGDLIRRIRAKMGVSQEGLARNLNTTKASIQHWEHGRNRPDVARWVALRRICPPGPERQQLDSLLRSAGRNPAIGLGGKPAINPRGVSVTNLARQEAENARLRKKILRLESMLKKKEARIRILSDLAAELQRELLSLRTSGSQ